MTSPQPPSRPQQMVECQGGLPPDWTRALTEILSRQRSICMDLQRHSRRQRQLIEQERQELLLTVLSERQNLIDELTVLSNNLEPFRMQWPELWARLDEAQQASVSRLVNEVQSLVDEIMTSDATDRDRIELEKQKLRDAMARLNHGRQSHRAYTSPGSVGRSRPGGNRFTDQQG